ncbi:MAG: hypothetical protein FWE62_02205 [Firmicutes bacterium]|nr:hypothetical protein [Bacillota bacterium]
MKTKLLTLTAVLLAVTAMAFLWTGCDTDKPEIPEGGAAIVIIIGADKYEVTTENEYVGQVLDELAETEDLVFEFTGTADSQYGRMIDKLGTLIPSGNEFIAFYSTSDNLQYSFPEMSVELEGVTYYSANFGADQMPVMDGVRYYFVLDEAWW